MRALALSLTLAVALALAVVLPSAAVESDTSTIFALTAGDTLHVDVAGGFTGIRVWTFCVRPGRWTYPSLKVYWTQGGGFTGTAKTVKAPKTNVLGFPLVRGGYLGNPSGKWNEWPALAADSYTIFNYQAAADSFLVEVLK